MVLKPGPGKNEEYTVRMLTENRIPGFLSFREKQVDGERWFYYDVTSRQPLGRILEHRNLRGKELERLAADLLFSLKQTERYLLDEKSMDLTPEMIYVDPDDLKANFCLLPGSGSQFEESFRKLARYILDHVDHTDGDAVVLAFALFRAGEKENLGIRDLEKCLRAGERDGKEDIFGENTGKEKLYEAERKMVREYGTGAAGELPRHQGEKQNGSEGKYRYSEIKKTDLSGETEELAEEKGLKHGKNLFSVLFAVLMAAVPVAVYFIVGIDRILEWKWGILAAEGVLMAGVIFFRVKKDEEETGETEEDWEVEFREEEDRERGGMPDKIEYRRDMAEVWGDAENNENGIYTDPNDLRTDVRQRESDEMQTVLLTGRQIYPATRRLVPENGGEDVLVRYFPFIIGKNREISDFCLNLPQISRIHAKIEEDKDGYMITDLNSTNGTSVNGRFLETNESIHIEPGEMLSFADQRYRFL